MYKIRRYTPEDRIQWNEFLHTAKNSSFLFNRDFMEYHSDRFQDYSLVIYEGDVLVGIIPANLSGDQFISHQGLTYGSVVVHRDTKLNTFLKIIIAVLKYLSDHHITTFLFKVLPRIYYELPADEVDWALFILEAKLYRRDTALAIDQLSPLPYQERRKRSIKKAQKLFPSIRCEGNKGFERYWNEILIPNMIQKHGVKPVHSLEEILLLASRFPDHIKQYNIYAENQIMAGCTMFLNKQVAHAQYISGSPEGRSNGYLDFLFDYLIQTEFKNHRYFDFGICNEENGMKINFGLLDWKEGFGARAVSHDFYSIETKNHTLLEQKWNPNE